MLDLAAVIRIAPAFSLAEQDRAWAASARDPRLRLALESPGYGLTQTLAAAPQLVARSAEASLDLGIEYRTGDPNLDTRSSQLRARRRENERNAAEVASETRELAGQLAGQLPVSDTAILLGVSKGRVTQLQAPYPRNTRKKAAATSTGR